MPSFLPTQPSNEDYWRGIVLLGRNVATYKLALAKSLLQLAPAGKTFNRWLGCWPFAAPESNICACRLVEVHIRFVAGPFHHCRVSQLCGCYSRTLDFRLTAREARKSQKPNYDKSLKIFGLASDDYSRATWRLFWPSCISLALGAVLFVVSVAAAYADRLY
jgi:hypothetical protein